MPDKSGVVATTSDLPDDYTVVTTAGNLANGDRAAADTTSAAFTLTLPASPANGDTIYVLDYAGTFDANNLTIGRNGNNIESLAEDLVCNVEKAAFSLVYAGSAVGWKVVPQTAQMPSTSLANTWQVNQTFNGTNNVAPNQTAASGSSLMTRDLGDARYGGQTFVAVASNVAMTQNNTTLEDITGASLVLPAGTYIITVKMFFSANASAGSKMAMAFDGTSSQRGFRQTITTSVVQAVAIGSFGSTSSATAAETEHYRVYECVVTAQGTLKLQGAQNVAGINALTASGFLKAEKIS